MRIIAGRFRSRRIGAPRGQHTRPTTDRVREALFQHLVSARLGEGFEGLRVLDLFAGSGALAFEAISRGAQSATLVDSSAAAARCQRDNAESLGCLDAVRCIRGSLPDALGRVEGPFDIVFADPPYRLDVAGELRTWLVERDLVSTDALLVFEHDGARPLGEHPEWTDSQTRRYGDTAVTIVRRRPCAAARE